MFVNPLITRASLLLALLGTVCGTTACGGSGQGSVTKAQVKPGEMPESGEWTGVYYSRLFGHLHVVKDGDSAEGRWRTAAGDKWGELHGKVDGNLLRFEWVEHKIGYVGPNASSKGHGYFKYSVPPGENVDHEIKGEIGLGESDAGEPWDAIKQRNQAPDMNSVMPDETQRYEGDSWDSSKKKSPGGGSSEPAEESWD